MDSPLQSAANLPVPLAGPSPEGRYRMNHPGAAPPTLAEELRRVLKALWRRRFTILFVSGATFVVAAAYLRLQPARFQSVATILVPDTRGNMTPAIATLQGMGSGNQVMVEAEFLVSHRVLSPVVEELDLNLSVFPVQSLPLWRRLTGLRGTWEIDKRDAFAHSSVGDEAVPGEYILTRQGSTVTATVMPADSVVGSARLGDDLTFAGVTLGLPESPEWLDLRLLVRTLDQAVLQLQGNLAINVRPRTLLDVSCRANTAMDAYNLCVVVTQSYMDVRTSVERSEAVASEDFLNRQAERVRERLFAAEGALEAFHRRNGIISLGDHASSVARELAGLEGQLDQLAAERSALANMLQLMDSDQGGGRMFRNLGGLPRILQSGTAGGIMSSLIQLQDQRRDLALLRSDTDPELQALDDQISLSEQRLRQVALGHDEALAIEQAGVEQRIADARTRVQDYPSLQSEQARLTRELGMLTTQYNFLEGRRRDAEVAAAVEFPGVQILDPPTIRPVPITRAQGKSLMLALGVGLAVGLSIAVLREFGDRTLKEPYEVESRTGLAVLSSVPRLRGETLVHQAVEAKKPGPLSRIAGRANRHQQRSLAREAFHSLLVDLDYMNGRVSTEEPSCIAVTSAKSGEGKTSVASNMALVHASSGRPTVLIDGDLRGAGLTRLLNVRSSPGLSDVLAGDATLDEALTSVEFGKNGQAGSVLVLPAGTPMLDPPSLFRASERLGTMLDTLKSRGSTIIVDTPPMNILSEAQVIVANADAVLVVVRSGYTERDALRTLLDRMARAGANVTGVVLNEASMPSYYRQYGSEYLTSAGMESNGKPA